jgi:hypothetical protein
LSLTAPLLEHRYHTASGHHLQSYWLFLLRIDKPWFLTEGKAYCCAHHTFRLGFPNCLAIIIIINYTSAIKPFSGAIAGEEKEDLCKGSFSHTHLYFVICFALLYLFLLASFYQKPKKIRILGSFYFFALIHYVVP